MGEGFSCSVGKYELNIQHKEDTVTVSSLKYPEIPAVTLSSDRHLKAAALWVILHADKYRHRFTIETFDAEQPHRTLVATKDLKADMVMDWQEDSIADPRRDNTAFVNKFQVVTKTDRKSDDCINVISNADNNCEFPPAHQITVVANYA